MGDHKITKCNNCKAIVNQCRCPDNNKKIEYVDFCDGCVKIYPTPAPATKITFPSREEFVKQLYELCLNMQVGEGTVAASHFIMDTLDKQKQKCLDGLNEYYSNPT